MEKGSESQESANEGGVTTLVCSQCLACVVTALCPICGWEDGRPVTASVSEEAESRAA